MKGQFVLLKVGREPGSHRRPSSGRNLMRDIDTGLRAGVAKLMEHNLPLAVASTLILLGLMSNVTAALFWGLLSRRTVLVFAACGILSWIFAMAILCIFPPSGAPRHAKDR